MEHKVSIEIGPRSIVLAFIGGCSCLSSATPFSSSSSSSCPWRRKTTSRNYFLKYFVRVSLFCSTDLQAHDFGNTAAAEMNSKAGFANLRVYGLLTDLYQFSFYSYFPDIKQFQKDQTIIVTNKRDGFLNDMIQGSLLSSRARAVY